FVSAANCPASLLAVGVNPTTRLPPQIIPPMSYSTLNGSRPVMVTRTSLHCQTCCQGRKRGSGGSLSSAVYATDVLSTDSAATLARISFFTATSYRSHSNASLFPHHGP